jgi:hypothetical protein
MACSDYRNIPYRPCSGSQFLADSNGFSTSQGE